jgi:hypothetical protein
MTTQLGCLCLDACARTLDLSPFSPMCLTFRGPALPANGTRTCAVGGFGTYSALRDAYWDLCTAAAGNASLAGAATDLLQTQLTTFGGMFFFMFFSALAGVALAYLLVAAALLWALRGSVPRAVMCLPCMGCCHVAIPGAVFSAIVSLVYLSIPYAIDLGVAVVLGLTMAAVLLFFAFNRDQPRHKPAHAVEFAEM